MISSLGPGDDQDVDIDGSGDFVTVDIVATLLDDDGETIGQIELSRDFAVLSLDIGGDSRGGVGDSGKFRFDLENNSGTDITLNGLRIVSTSNDAEEADQLEDSDGNEIISPERGPIEVGDDEITTFDTNVTIENGETVERLEFDEFDEGMNNESITIEVRADTGAKATLTID